MQQDSAQPADSIAGRAGAPVDSGAHQLLASESTAIDTTTGIAMLGAPAAIDSNVVTSPYGVADPGLQPQPLDTALSGHPVTRPQSRMQYGWIRVAINGGSAPATIDGRRYGSTPVVARVEVGQHLVSVLGGGDAFLPSQISVNVTANDTLPALFSTPEAAQRAERARQQRDSASRAQQAAPPAEAQPDSTPAAPRT